MNIESSIPYQAFPSVGYAINLSQSGKVSVPVSPSSYIYSHFEHVSGVPAPDGVDGVNISKLKIINTLIDQLSRMKQQAEPSIYMTEEESEIHMNALIEQYQNQIRTIQEANANNPYASTTPLLGVVFSISV